jgi:hypothetical protein
MGKHLLAEQQRDDVRFMERGVLRKSEQAKAKRMAAIRQAILAVLANENGNRLVPNCPRFICAERGEAVEKGGKILWIAWMERDHPKVADTLFGKEFIARFLALSTKAELPVPHDEFSLQEFLQFCYGLGVSRIV